MIPFSSALAPVGLVDNVQPHPNSDMLDLVTIMGFTNVANRPLPGQPRYKVGDYAVVLRENLILPEYLIRHLHMWDEAKNKGGLAGSRGNRTKPRRVAGILSEVALCAVTWERHADQPVLSNSKSVQQSGTASIAMSESGFDDVAVIIAKVIDSSDAASEDISPVGYDFAPWLGIEPYIQPA